MGSVYLRAWTRASLWATQSISFLLFPLFSFNDEEEVIEFLKRYKKGQCNAMTEGYDGHGAGLILRIQLIIDIVLVEMIFIDDIFLS